MLLLSCGSWLRILFCRGWRHSAILPVCALHLLAVSLLEQSAQAASRTWTNTGTDFNAGASWGGTAPGSSDIAVFSTAAIMQPNLSASLTIKELNFSTTLSSGYDLTSSSTSIKLTLTSTGTGTTGAISAANTSGTNTIDAPIILGAAAGSTETFTQANGGTLAINGVISNTNSVTLSLTGGIFQLAGANTYSGGTTLASGTTLRINNATALGTGTFTINGGTIDNTSAGSITLTNDNAQAWSGDFTFTGTKDLNVGTGAVTMNASRIITVNGGTLTVGGAISGATFGITKAGVGTLILNGVVGTTSGTVTINSSSGTLTLAGNNSYTGGTTLNSGSTLNINAAGTSITNSAIGTGTFTINGGTIDNTSGSTITLATNNAQTWNGDFTFTGSNNLNLGTGAVSLGTTAGTSRTVTVNANTLTVGGVISNGTTANSLIKSGTGVLNLTGSNTFTGSATINAGTLSVSSLANGGSNSNLGASTNAATNLILSGGTLAYAGAAVSTDRLFSVGTSGGTIDASGSGAVNFTNTGSMGFNSQTGTRTLTLTGTNTGSNTLAAIVGDNTGATSLVKNGAGTWVLTGTNTYTGATTTNSGTLLVNGSLASGSAVTVNNSGSILGGIGTINGSVSIASSGAILQAGTGSTGQTLTMKGAVTMGSGSIIQLALGASSAHSTLAIGVGGSISFQSLQKFNIIDLGVTSGSTYNGLITGIGSNPGTESGWTIANQSWAYTFGYDSANGGEIDLTVTALPEPSTYIAGLLAFVAFGCFERRRIRKFLAVAAVFDRRNLKPRITRI
jgi:fibronectin-binding autotransporter adhesin